MTRIILLSLSLVATLLWTTQHASAQTEPFTRDDTLQAIQDASDNTGVSYWWIYNTVACETGHTFNPYARGRLGEMGAAQLYPRGNAIGVFYRYYSDPNNPYEAIQFLAEALRGDYKGLGSWTWTCA